MRSRFLPMDQLDDETFAPRIVQVRSRFRIHEHNYHPGQLLYFILRTSWDESTLVHGCVRAALGCVGWRAGERTLAGLDVRSVRVSRQYFLRTMHLEFRISLSSTTKTLDEIKWKVKPKQALSRNLLLSWRAAPPWKT